MEQWWMYRIQSRTGTCLILLILHKKTTHEKAYLKFWQPFLHHSLVHRQHVPSFAMQPQLPAKRTALLHGFSWVLSVQINRLRLNPNSSLTPAVSSYPSICRGVWRTKCQGRVEAVGVGEEFGLGLNLSTKRMTSD